ncbi:MAG: metallophosphoesterase family protein [Candidatus Aenigmatarchaeota archaeon]
MRIAVIADIHSNLPALRSVMREVQTERPEYILCLGDIVGYGPHPNKVVELMERDATEIISVKGNHDEAVLGGKVKKLQSNAAEAVEWTIERIKDENLEVLENFDTYEALEIDGYKFFAVHGSPRDHLNEYVDRNTSDETLNGFLEDTGADVLLMGHTHVPYIRSLERGLAINPGSVGQPRDRDRRASYAIVDIKRRVLDIRRVSYNVNKTADDIKQSRLPDRLGDRLYYGH